MPLSRENSLTRKMAAATLLAALVVATLFAGIESFTVYRSELQDIQTDIGRILDAQKDSAAKAVYELDAQLGNQIISGLRSITSLTSARIIDDYGTTLAAFTVERTRPALGWLTTFAGIDDLVIRRDLRASSQNMGLGHIEVVVDRIAVLDQHLIQSLSRASWIGAQFFIVALVLGWLFHRQIVRPLLDMVGQISHISPGDPYALPVAAPHALRRTEIGLLAKAVNDLVRGATLALEQSRQSEARLLTSRQRLARAQDIAQMGSFERNLITGETFWSMGLYRLLGHPSTDAPSPALTFMGFLHEEDLAAITSELDELIAQGSSSLERDIRFKRLDGTPRHGSLAIEIGYGPDAQAQFVYGTIIDITARKSAEQALRKSEERYALTARGANDGLWDWDLETGEVYFSPRYKEMLGYADDELDASYGIWAQLLHPDDKEQSEATANDVAEGRADSFEMIFRLRHRDGSLRWILSRGAALRGQDGTCLRMAGTHTDITALKEAEQALAQTEERYRTIFENEPIGIFRTTLDGQLLEVNPAMAAIFGFPDRETMIAQVRDVGNDLYATPLLRKRVIDQLLLSGRRIQVEVEFQRLGGERFLANMNISMTAETADGTVYLDGAIEDITERRRAETALRDSEERFRKLFEEMQEGSALHRIVVDDAGKPTDCIYLAVNPAFESFSGLSAKDIIGRRGSEVLPGDNTELLKICGQIAQGAPPRTLSTYLPDTRQFFQTRIYSPEPGHFATIFTDITQEKAAEDRLRASEAKYREIFDSTSDAIILHDMRTLVCLDVNAAFRELTGYIDEEFQILTPAALSSGEPPYDEAGAQAVIDRIKAGETVACPWPLRRKDGSLVWTECVIKNVYLDGQETIMAVFRDITERKKLQEVMVQTEKMMSVGGLAAGIAHEINNPLGIILQMTQNLSRRLSRDFPANATAARDCGLDLDRLAAYMERRGLDQYIEAIRNAGERAATIVRSMLDFSRKSDSNRTLCDMAVLLDQTLELAARDYDLKKRFDFRRIVIERDYAPDLPPVECSETEISQVFLNIIKNAAQAMAGNPTQELPPRIQVRTSRDNDQARIEIINNGPPMDEATRRRIFEPFFTTKPPGQGTGLGMSVSYFIVTNKHGGSIMVDSGPKNRVRFVVRLPLPGSPQSRSEGQ